MIEALVAAHPKYVTTADLHEATDCTPAQFAGVMGAFGRRMVNTSGYDDTASFFDWRWNEPDGTYECRLPDSVLEAVRLEGLA